MKRQRWTTIEARRRNKVQYTNLGRTGLKVSRLCLGTMNYGPHAEEASAHQQMDRALELGINFFDTADVYGAKKAEGITEQIIGRWFAKGARREKVILATKVHGDMDLDSNDHAMKRGLSSLKIRRACEYSLKRLQTDYIDVYQMHHIPRNGSQPQEIWEALELLVKQGKVVYTGSSNFPGWNIAQWQEAAKRRNFMGLVSEQCKYSLITRASELEVLPACEAYGLGVIPWSPLEGGILGGALQKMNEGRRANENVQKRVEHLRPQLERFESFCRELGEAPANVALAWTLSNPVITAPIIGPRTIAQLEESIRATEIKLDEAALRRLDRIFPGPAGTKDPEGIADWHKQRAPEAYAW
jgi:aryl-alcohol dehydrogenase-like predicted oxidoreductase